MGEYEIKPTSSKSGYVISLLVIFLLVLLISSAVKFTGPVNSNLANFKVVFLSIVLEALPFILIGVVVSAILETFVSEEVLFRIFPRNRYASILMACMLGLIFPICECGIVPVARRLVSKGVPLYSAIAFMLAAPIINPVAISSTAVAFTSNHTMVGLRLIMALIVSYTTGLLVSWAVEGKQLNPIVGLEGCGCGCEHVFEATGTGPKIYMMLQASCAEFFEMGKYLIIGAFLGALAQTFIPRNILLGVGQHTLFSIIVLIAFAFAVSVCSSADAFIAASFASSFTPGALLAFMVFGPMVDIKNTLMLSKAFKTRFVLFLLPVIVMLVVTITYTFNILGS